MKIETKKVSLVHIKNNLRYIEELLTKSKYIDFDFRNDIKKSINEIDTEINSWAKELKEDCDPRRST